MKARVYYVHASSVSAQGTERDNPERVACVADRTGDLAAVQSAVFSALDSMEPVTSSSSAKPSPVWLRQLQANAITGYAVTGNDGTHPFSRALSPQAVQAKLRQLVPALRQATVLAPSSVRSTDVALQSWGRTHARSLALALRDGSTLNISAGYARSKATQPQSTDPNLFRVTYATARGTTSVFVRDGSGVLHQAWTLVRG